MSCVFQKTSLVKLSPRYFKMDIVVDKKLVRPVLSIAVHLDSLLDVNSVLWPHLRPSPCLIFFDPLSLVFEPVGMSFPTGQYRSTESPQLGKTGEDFSLTGADILSPYRVGVSSQTVSFHFGSSLMSLCPVSKVCGLLSNRVSVPISYGQPRKGWQSYVLFWEPLASEVSSIWHWDFFCFKTYSLLLGAVLSSLAGYLCSCSSRIIMLS